MKHLYIGFVAVSILAMLLSRCGTTPQHGPSSNKMALITSDCGAMCSPGTK